MSLRFAFAWVYNRACREAAHWGWYGLRGDRSEKYEPMLKVEEWIMSAFVIAYLPVNVAHQMIERAHWPIPDSPRWLDAVAVGSAVGMYLSLSPIGRRKKSGNSTS